MLFSADHQIEPETGAPLGFLGALTLPFSSEPATALEIVRLPDLPLHDGSVVASDGFILGGLPFRQRLSPGAHELRLAVATIAGGDARVAFAILGPLARDIASFELARTEGQELADLKPGNVFGYPVDAGVGSFASPEMHAELETMGDLARLTAETMKSVYRHTRDWCTVRSANGSAAIFSSGYGDGLYASYFGLDAAGDRIVLVTDFTVVDWSRNPTA